MTRERAYTVREIDDLRSVLKDRFIWGTSFRPYDGRRTGVSYSPDDLLKTVEEQIRTYMTAGITADDIRKEDAEEAARKQAGARLANMSIAGEQWGKP